VANAGEGARSLWPVEQQSELSDHVCGRVRLEATQNIGTSVWLEDLDRPALEQTVIDGNGVSSDIG